MIRNIMNLVFKNFIFVLSYDQIFIVYILLDFIEGLFLVKKVVIFVGLLFEISIIFG